MHGRRRWSVKALKKDLRGQAKDLLFKYELAERLRQSLMAQHKALFERLDEIDTQQEELKAEIKRVFYTDSGPPPEVQIGSAQVNWATGDSFHLQVTYKRKGACYDPAQLPVEVFATPKIVTGVDKAICDALATKDGRVRGALVQGEWMTPSVSLPRVTGVKK